MPAFRSVMSVLLRALGDVSLHPQGRPLPATTGQEPGNRPHPHAGTNHATPDEGCSLSAVRRADPRPAWIHAGSGTDWPRAGRRTHARRSDDVRDNAGHQQTDNAAAQQPLQSAPQVVTPPRFSLGQRDSLPAATASPANEAGGRRERASPSGSACDHRRHAGASGQHRSRSVCIAAAHRGLHRAPQVRRRRPRCR
jgi:hypothetical protein